MSPALAVLFAFLPQGEGRAIGRVLDAAGSPLAGAEVTLLSRPIPRSLAGAADRRAVAADEQGMFRAALRRDARYSVWAASEHGATAVAEGVMAGEFLELRVEPGTAPVELELSGTAAWPGADAFRLRVIVGGENIDFAELERRGDRWIVPALPPRGQRTIEVLDARGEVLWADAMARTPDGGSLAIPPPAEYRVEVRGEDGEPLAGVEVLWHIKNYWYSESDALPYGERFRALWPVMGTTDEEGGLELRVPWPAGEKDLWLISRKDGYVMSIDGISAGCAFESGRVDARERKPKGEPVRVTLRRGKPVVVPLSVDRDTALGEDWLYLVCRVHVSRRGGRMGTPFTAALPVVGGKARLAAPLPHGTDVEIAEFVLGRELAERLQASHGFAPRRVFRVPSPENLLGHGGQSVPDPTAARSVQVTAADGRPAARSAVLIHDLASKKTIIQRADRLGRTLVRSGRDLRLAVLGEHGIGVGAAAADEQGPVALQLQPMRRLRVRLSTESGEPVAGELVRVRMAERRPERAGGLLWGAHELLSMRPGVLTGPDGRAELPVPPVECRLALSCGRRVVTGKTVDIDPSAAGEPHELVVGPGR